MITLPFPRSHIVDNSIAPHMCHSISFADSEARLTNYQTNLTFIVKAVREARVRIYLLTARDNGSKPLGEDDRMGGSCSKPNAHSMNNHHSPVRMFELQEGLI